MTNEPTVGSRPKSLSAFLLEMQIDLEKKRSSRPAKHFPQYYGNSWSVAMREWLFALSTFFHAPFCRQALGGKNRRGFRTPEKDFEGAGGCGS